MKSTEEISKYIRLQLNEQLRCLDIRMESQVSLIQELQDFFRRRGEVELDYSKSLDKLAKSLQLRHKEQKQKREQWPIFSSYACWQQLVNQTKSLSKDHLALSEIYSTHLVARLQTVIDDVQRIYRKCREIGYETHEEILRVLQELHTTMKTYHRYQTECNAAEAKLRAAENQRMKLQQTIPKEKLERSKKYRLIEKEVQKRKDKYTDARLKALKAKNEYQLCLEASNTTIHKYFVEDLSDLIDCMDLGFHSMVSRALLMHVTADQGRCRAVLHGAETLSHTVHSMDSRADKQKFLEQHHGAFMIPKRLEFQGQNQGDEIMEPELQKALHAEMEARLQKLGQRVSNLRTESDEIWKTLETAEINLLEILNTKDYDCNGYFGDASLVSIKPEALTIKLRSDKQEIEEFYITKIREYILGTSRLARLDSKAELLRSTLAKDSVLNTNTLVKSNVPKRKRIGRMNMTGQPKLFGGSLEEYLEATGEEIPLIMRSCIRVINLFGLHHQGIFRVSGSQVEISNFREGFERGEDPLADTTDASDINSVAGVLKLFLRELREPLFPIIYFDHFVTLAQLDSKQEVVLGIRKFLVTLPHSVVVVIRYLFAFLNHLSEYSDENMMDAYNLAICFGPTLMPAPEDKDQVQYQNQVNELIKNMIVFHEELFAKDLSGVQYEKYISSEPFLDIDVGDSPTDQVTEDPDSEVYPSEDESDTMEATAQFDFTARSSRELSLRKGDNVVLRKQVSNDWWQGTVNGKDGLIPDKYISLKIKDDDRDKSSDHLKSSSSEESVRKRRPSGNISLHSQLSVFTQHSQQSTEPDTSPLPKQQVLSSAHAPSAQIINSTAISNNTVTATTNNNNNTNATNTQPLTIIEKSEPVCVPKAKQPPLCTDFHYESVEQVKSKYNYHDEPHSFENSMEFLEDFNHFQFEKKPSEPIYAEPSKVHSSNNQGPSSSATPSPTPSGSSSVAQQSMHFDEYDGVQLRHSATASNSTHAVSVDTNGHHNNRKSETPKSGMGVAVNELPTDSKIRHSDTQLCKDIATSGGGCGMGEIITVAECPDEATDANRPQRKYHSKSFSLSENRVAASSNLFHQNRELWEKRVGLSSQQSLTAPRILSRNRIAPDLVMDLPLSVTKEGPTRSSRDSLDSELEDMTSAERFAAQNQSTLKKNERFSSESNGFDGSKLTTVATAPIKEKPKAEVRPQEAALIIKETDDNMLLHNELHIDEENHKMMSGGDKLLASPLQSDLPKKSPIPARNTQKFVSQFADLHLTGGCMSQPTESQGGGGYNSTNSQTVVACSAATRGDQQTTTLSSFKPQVKVKPQLKKKPHVLPPTTPEMVRRGHD